MRRGVNMSVIISIIGYIGMACAIVSFQSDRKKIIVIFQALTGLMFTIHFGMLAYFEGENTIAAAVLNVFATIRGFTYACRETKYGNLPVFPYIFAIGSLIIGFFTWEGYLTVLPTLSMVISSIGLWLKNTRMVRFLSLPASLLWWVYNLINHSWAGLCTEIFVTTSLLIAIYRFDIRKQKNNNA